MLKSTRYKYKPYRTGRFPQAYKKLKARNVFMALIGLSVLSIFLPTWLTGPTERFSQALLAPGGRLTMLAARQINPSRGKSIETEDTLTDAHLLRMLTAISARLQELERENRSLLGIRSVIGSGQVLVPARVTGFDSLGLPSITIDRGTDDGVREGLAVLATLPLDVLQRENLDPKMTLAGGVIVGTVDHGLGPVTARVKLIGAKGVKLFGHVVRFVDGRTHTIARVHLEGTQNGNKLIAEMVRADRGVRTGDFVIPEKPEELNLPVPMILGVVEKVETRTDVRLLVDLTIKPLFDRTRLNRVYVLTPQSE